MPAQNLWKVEIINRDQFGDVWQAINSQVHLKIIKIKIVIYFNFMLLR